MTGFGIVIVCLAMSAFASVTAIATSLERSAIVTIAPGALAALASSGSTSAWSDVHARSSFLGSAPAGTANVTVVVHWPSAVSVHGVAASIDVDVVDEIVALGAGALVGSGGGASDRTTRAARCGVDAIWCAGS